MVFHPAGACCAGLRFLLQIPRCRAPNKNKAGPSTYYLLQQEELFEHLRPFACIMMSYLGIFKNRDGKVCFSVTRPLPPHPKKILVPNKNLKQKLPQLLLMGCIDIDVLYKAICYRAAKGLKCPPKNPLQ